MKYGIADNQSKKFLLIADQLDDLLRTVNKHMPQFCVDDIKEYADSDVESGCDGCFYLKGGVKQPTREEVQSQRRQYRLEHCDYLTLEKVRKMSLGCWTAEDEDAYVKNMQDVEDYIAQNLAYPNLQEQVFKEASSIVPHMGIDI